MNQTSSTDPSRFSIVVGLKFSDGGAFAVEQAARLAQRIPGAALQLVHVFEEPLTKDSAVAMIGHLQLYANEKVASLGGLNGRTVGVHVRSGDVAREVVQLGVDVLASLIVLGAEVRGLPSLRTTRTADCVIALATCPVLVAGPKPAPAAVAEPAIEPPCPDCVATRQATAGKEWWCARHSVRALEGHAYSYQRELPFATRDSLLGPTGI